MSVYSTGEIARLCGVSVRTVQFYDGKGLLPPSEISEGGRRLYSKADVEQLRFICMLKTLGLSLDSIKEILQSEQKNEILLLLLQQQEKRICTELQLDSISMSNAEKRRGNSGALSLRHRGNYERQKATSYHTRHDAGRRHCDGCPSAGTACALDCKRRLASVCRGNAVCHCHGHLDDAVLPSACFLCLPALPRGIPSALSRVFLCEAYAQSALLNMYGMWEKRLLRGTLCAVKIDFRGIANFLQCP